MKQISKDDLWDWSGGKWGHTGMVDWASGACGMAMVCAMFGAFLGVFIGEKAAIDNGLVALLVVAGLLIGSVGTLIAMICSRRKHRDFINLVPEVERYNRIHAYLQARLHSEAKKLFPCDRATEEMAEKLMDTWRESIRVRVYQASLILKLQETACEMPAKLGDVIVPKPNLLLDDPTPNLAADLADVLQRFEMTKKVDKEMEQLRLQ